jgi:hypothetical protein
MASLLRLPPIPRSPEDIRYEKDPEWSNSYRRNARDFFPDSPSLDVALTSDFPQGRYNDGLIAFLCAFRGLLPRVTATQGDYIQSTPLLGPKKLTV